MLKTRINRFISIGTLFVFLANFWALPQASAQGLVLPVPGHMVPLSLAFSPVVLKGIKLEADNPFRFHFFVDKGEGSLSQDALKAESSKLIKYFLASLTIPENDLWVNLSPYEKNRIVPEAFGQTEMGRDLLAQDYLLKQITASLIYPEGELGKKFWKEIYTKAQAQFGTTNIPVNTFNKVWIVPEKAVVYENGGTAFVLENHLKVMLEEDYLAINKTNLSLPLNGLQALGGRLTDSDDVNKLGSQIIRSIVLPALEKEVNEGKNFAQLRQVFYSLILATWYKKKIKDSILNKVLGNQNKIKGVHVDVQDKEQIYGEYLAAFKKGVYNYIKDEPDLITGQTIPRKYFSGGVEAKQIAPTIQYLGLGHSDFAMSVLKKSHLTEIDGDFAMINSPSSFPDSIQKQDMAMVGSIPSEQSIKKAREILAKALLRPKDYNWDQDRDSLEALKGQYLGKTGYNGEISFNVAPGHKHQMSLSSGEYRKDSLVSVSDIQTKGHLLEITLKFEKEGLPIKETKFQVGRYTKKVDDLDVLVLDDRIGLRAVAEIINRQPSLDWTKENIPNMVGMEFGRTDTRGAFSVAVESGFNTAWTILGKRDPGWDGKVISQRVKLGFLEFVVLFSKQGEPSIY